MMREQLGSIPSAPVTSLPLKLSSAIITSDGSRCRELGPRSPLQLELSISVRVLGGFEIVLATTSKSRGSADDSLQEIPAAERCELHVNPILLSLVPDVIHLSGRGHGPHCDEAAARSYTLTLTFSDGSATTRYWSTTFKVPRSRLVDSTWRQTVPFSHSLTSAAHPPHTR